MNLHETEYGRRFFNSQLPSLIKALERIAESLSAPKQSLSADFVADPDFLHDLYYGDYEPSVFKTQSEHQKQLNHNRLRLHLYKSGPVLHQSSQKGSCPKHAPGTHTARVHSTA